MLHTTDSSTLYSMFILMQMDDRLDDAKEYDRLALDLMTHYK